MMAPEAEIKNNETRTLITIIEFFLIFILLNLLQFEPKMAHSQVSLPWLMVFMRLHLVKKEDTSMVILS